MLTPRRQGLSDDQPVVLCKPCHKGLCERFRPEPPVVWDDELADNFVRWYAKHYVAPRSRSDMEDLRLDMEALEISPCKVCGDPCPERSWSHLQRRRATAHPDDQEEDEDSEGDNQGLGPGATNPREVIKTGDLVIYKGEHYWVMKIIEYENAEDTVLLGLTDVSDDLDEIIGTAKWEVPIKDLKLICTASCTRMAIPEAQCKEKAKDSNSMNPKPTCSLNPHPCPSDTCQTVWGDPTMHQLTAARATLLEARMESYKAQLAEVNKRDNEASKDKIRRAKWNWTLQREHRTQSGSVIQRARKTKGRFSDPRNPYSCRTPRAGFN